MTQELRQSAEYDVFENDLFLDEEPGHETIGRWGVLLLHILKGAFVLYSGAHNVGAALTAAGNNPFAMVAQIIGVLVLECTISALYMAGIGGRITGRAQTVVAALFWLLGMILGQLGHCSR